MLHVNDVVVSFASSPDDVSVPSVSSSNVEHLRKDRVERSRSYGRNDGGGVIPIGEDESSLQAQSKVSGD